MSQIFISHNSADASIAHELTARLLSVRPHTTIALSSEPAAGPPGGSDWRWWIRRTIRSCDVVVLVASRASWSPWCSAELGMARLLDTPIVPVVVGDDAAVVNPIVGDVQGMPVTGSAEALWRRIDDLVGGSTDPDTPLPPDFVPYPGLAALNEQQERILSGRSDERRRILDDFERLVVGDGRFLVVSGPSGSGKSSLVRAGVVPTLRTRGWAIIGPTQPRQLLDEGVPEVGATRPCVVIVDQFEELDSLSDTDRNVILDWLTAAVERGANALIVVRSEFRTRVGEWIPKPIDHYVPFVAVEDLYDIIRTPAKLVQLDIDESLVDRLVLETGSGAALPLLAFTLHELWERRDRIRMTIDASALDALDGVQGLLERRADEALHSASDGDSATAEKVLATLTRLASTEHVPPTRTPIRSRSLSDDERSWLDEFVARGLLAYRTSYALDDHTGDLLGPSGDAVVDVTHEWLFGWDRLADAIERERDRNRFLQSVTTTADAWNEGARSDASLLLAGDRLELAVALGLDRADDDVGEFVTASIRGDHARKVRRALTFGIAGVAAVAVVAAVVAVVGFVRAGAARQDAEQSELLARSVGMAARADQLIDQHRDEAMITAVAAYRTDHNSTAEGALLNTLASPRGPLRYYRDAGANWATARMTATGRGVVVDRELRPATFDLATRTVEPISVLGAEITAVVPGRTPTELVVWGRRPPAAWVVGTVDTDGTLELVEHDVEITIAVVGPDELLFGDVDGRVLSAVADDVGWSSPDVVDTHPDASITDISVYGDLLASASRAAVRLQRRAPSGWGVADEIWSVPPGTPAAERVAFRPTADPPELFAVGSDPTIHRWQFADGGAQTMTSPGTDSGIVQAMAFEPGGGVLFTAGREGRLQRWDAVAGAALGDPLQAHRDVVLRISAGSPTSVLTADAAGTAILWDLERSRVVERRGVVPSAWKDVAFQALVEGDGPLAGVAGERILVADGSELPAPPRTRRAWWTADGDAVVETGDLAQVDAGVRSLWLVGRDGSMTALAEHVDAVAVGPCRSAVASGDPAPLVRLLPVAGCTDPETRGVTEVELPGDAIVAMAWSPDGDRLAVVRRDNSLSVVQPTGAVDDWLPRRDGVVVTSLAWLSDDLVAIGHDAGADVELVELADTAATPAEAVVPVRRLRGHDDAVWWFASDGRRLASAGQDGLVVVSDITTATPIGAPLVGARRTRENDPAAVVRGISWRDDGTLVAIHGTRLVAWELDPERLIERSCASAQLPLTNDEIASIGSEQIDDPCSTVGRG